MADMCQVNPDLVRASRLQRNSQLADSDPSVGAGIRLDDSPMGHCVAALSLSQDCDLSPVPRAAPQRRIDRALWPVEAAPHESDIGPLEAIISAVRRELPRQSLVGGICFGNYEQAAGILVEPVHDAWPHHPTDSRQAWPAMRDEGIDQCPLIMAWRWVHDQSGWFVDHNQVIVFPDDIEGNFLGLRLRRFGWR